MFFVHCYSIPFLRYYFTLFEKNSKYQSSTNDHKHFNNASKAPEVNVDCTWGILVISQCRAPTEEQSTF